MRTIAIFCLVSLIDSTVAFSQVADKPVPAKDAPLAAEPTLIIVYHLRHTSSGSAMETLKIIGPPCQIAQEGRQNALLILGSRDAHNKIEQLLKELDAPTASKESTEILHLDSKAMEANVGFVSEFAKMLGVEIAFVEEPGIFVIKGPKDEVERASDLVREIGKISNRKSVENSKLRSQSIRIFWLSNDPQVDSRNVFEPDATLSKSIQRLGELGFANMKVKMQMMGRCDMVQGRGRCQVDGSYLAGNTRRKLHAQAELSGMGSGPIDGKITLEASVDETQNSGLPSASVSVQVAIHLEPKKYYILSASPVGGFQNAFVVQLIEDL